MNYPYSTTPIKRGRFDRDSKGFKRGHSISFTDISRNRFQPEIPLKSDHIALLTQQLEDMKMENRKEIEEVKQTMEEQKSRISIIEDVCVNKIDKNIITSAHSHEKIIGDKAMPRMKKRELQELCDSYNISYGEKETKAILIEKIKLARTMTQQDEVVSIPDEEALWRMKKPDVQDICVQFEISFKMNDTKTKLIKKLLNSAWIIREL